MYSYILQIDGLFNLSIIDAAILLDNLGFDPVLVVQRCM